MITWDFSNIQREKTHITHWSTRFRFLGYDLRGHRNPNGSRWLRLSIPPEKERDLKAKVKRLCTSGQLPELHLFVRVNAQLVGWTNYYRYANNATDRFLYLTGVAFWLTAHFLGRKRRCSLKRIMRLQYARDPKKRKESIVHDQRHGEASVFVEQAPKMAVAAECSSPGERWLSDDEIRKKGTEGYIPGEPDAATSSPSGSEGAGQKRAPAKGERAALRPYLNELDQAIHAKMALFSKGKARKTSEEYRRASGRVERAKKQARQNGNWTAYKALRKQMLSIPSGDLQDPDYRRLFYTRYADDFLVAVIGAKTEAVELKAWLEHYLRDELQLELSAEKTLITHARKRVRFLGYDIIRWKGQRIVRTHTKRGPITRRSGAYQLRLLMPQDKISAFAKIYGDTRNWHGKHRNHLLNLSELEILLIYNAEVRGFLGYYSLADNLTKEAHKILWLTTGSFFRTIAGKRQSTVKQVARSLKRGPGRHVMTIKPEGKPIKEYELLSSTRQLKKGVINYQQPDLKPNVLKYKSRTELGKRLLAQQCEWCGTREGMMEVHHVRKLGNLTGKAAWERQMIQRRRKTMVLCEQCHDELHAGKLLASKRMHRGKRASQLR